MKIDTYNVFNPDKIVKIKFNERVKRAFGEMDRILKYLNEINPAITAEYLAAIAGRLGNVVGSYRFNGTFDRKEATNELLQLNNHPDLLELVLQFTCNHLNLPEGFQPGSEEIDVTSLNNVKASERLSYHAIKALAEVLGDEQGIQTWKKIIGRRLNDENSDYKKRLQEKLEKGEKLSSPAELREQAIKIWTEMGLADFTRAIFDDHKVLYRFDRCLTHEALKELNDPDFAYLCSCYIGDTEEFNAGPRYLRRTQTLHHGDFCDELYWWIDFYDNPEQPSLEFTRSLGKE
ncbi:MAG: L-2-amino-thiazoline-4-carboxylic acid hydrolase [Candidatus Odinarchaeota archaeon]